VAGTRVVVLAHRYDAGARTVAHALAPTGGGPPLVLAPEELAGCRWRHAVGTDGRTATALVLRSGARLRDEDIGCVFNRIDHLPVPRFARSAPRDRDYAAMELQSLVASWLAGLGSRVVNPVGSRATDAGPSSPWHWLSIAAGHGLPVADTVVATSARTLSLAGVRTRVRPLGPWVARSGAVTGRVPVGRGWSVPPEAPASLPDPDWEVVVAGDTAVGPLAPRFGDACAGVLQQTPCLLAGFRFVAAEGDVVLREITTRRVLDQPWAVLAAVRLLGRVAAGRPWASP